MSGDAGPEAPPALCQSRPGGSHRDDWAGAALGPAPEAGTAVTPSYGRAARASLRVAGQARPRGRKRDSGSRTPARAGPDRVRSWSAALLATWSWARWSALRAGLCPSVRRHGARLTCLSQVHHVPWGRARQGSRPPCLPPRTVCAELGNRGSAGLPRLQPGSPPASGARADRAQPPASLRALSLLHVRVFTHVTLPRPPAPPRPARARLAERAGPGWADPGWAGRPPRRRTVGPARRSRGLQSPSGPVRVSWCRWSQVRGSRCASPCPQGTEHEKAQTFAPGRVHSQGPLPFGPGHSLFLGTCPLDTLGPPFLLLSVLGVLPLQCWCRTGRGPGARIRSPVLTPTRVWVIVTVLAVANPYVPGTFLSTL